MRNIFVLALTLAAVAAAPSKQERIIGGSLTTINQYPTIAALLFSSNSVNYAQNCGGTIVNDRSVLTAAHCTVGWAANRWRVRVGSTYANSGGVVHSLSSIINHPNYNRRNYDFDVAIVKTTSPIELNQCVRPALLAGPNYNLGDNQAVWAAGWGNTSPTQWVPSEQLRHVQVWTVNQNICRERYAAAGNTVTDNMLCSGWLDVGGRDQCQNDSGGPLYHNGIVVGVCSWGRGCALAQYPGVNARVSRFTTWIQANA